MSGRPPGELQEDIDALKNKTEMNREQARAAKEAADKAQADAAEAEDVGDMEHARTHTRTHARTHAD